MKVLVVDDDVVSRMMLMHLVDSCGKYDILEAEDGADAWRQLEAGLRPAITFCDLRMPQLSGTELLARVKAHPDLPACLSCWSRPRTTARPSKKRARWAPTAMSSSRSASKACART
jgi:CheY-like chemotaxis protein